MIPTSKVDMLFPTFQLQIEVYSYDLTCKENWEMYSFISFPASSAQEDTVEKDWCEY